MKTKNIVLAVIVASLAQSFAFADRQLDRAEITQIFQTLTRQPRKTWIPSGCIEARHIAYNASDGYTTGSTVIVKYDGGRFYWEINIDSHSKESEPEGSSVGESSQQDNLDLNWNRKRVFVWDGARYTMYFGPGNQAIVSEGSRDVPVAVNGPLTAGIVPWGYGIYTLESLLAAQTSAVEVEVNGRKEVHLTLNKTDIPETIFVLEPEKDFAVLFCSLSHTGRMSITKTYGDYELVSDKWVPTTIIIERHDDSKQPAKLSSYDHWSLTSIRVSFTEAASFRVPYEADTLVEYYSRITHGPLLYRYYNEVDTDLLLQDRLAILANEAQPHNCATVAMNYVSRQFGKNVTEQKLAELVNEPNKDTSLYELRRFTQDLGLHCLAVKTDMKTLMNLQGCQVILHLPAVNHYVVLEYIDEEYAWIIDLDSNNFFYRTKVDQFGADWSDGTALLISNKPLELEGLPTEISDDELHKIIGSTGGGFSSFSCTDLIQGYDIQFCSEPIGGLCGGRYRKWYNRYGCEPDPEGGSCFGTGMVGNVSSPCINDPEDPLVCIITGEWYSQFIRACQ